MPIFLKNFVNKVILKLILAIFVIEIFSLISFKSALLSAIFFILISIAALLFTLYKLEYGLYIALIELIIGSYGYLFYLQLPGFKAPIRLAIFLIVFFVWLFKYFQARDFFNLLKKSRIVQNLILFLAFLGIGFINGLLHHNGLTNTFFDFNGYLYFGLFFVFLEVFKNEKQIINFLKILIASLIYISLKIFITLYFFSHGFLNISDLLYHWIRDTRVGEITYAGANFFRIFFQSQIWSLIGIFVILGLIIAILLTQKKPLCHPEQSVGSITAQSPKFLTEFTLSVNEGFGMTGRLFLLLIIIQTSILISLSRSFWLGGIAGFLALFAYLIFKERLKLKKLAQIFLIILISGIISILLLISIANFPIPKPSSELALLLFKNRFTAFFGEAGVSSRWNQLPVLTAQIKKAPILGTGFGTSLTYKSNDPRIKNESNPEGWYTTYTFEWGYLDTITEMGIIGLLIYLGLIAQIFYRGFAVMVSSVEPSAKPLYAGFLIGLIVLIVVNMFSPYLNHPLGISYLMLCTAIFQIKKTDKIFISSA
jgi:hypothetical protein